MQATVFPIKKKLELYGVTSRIFGDADAGFGKGREFTGGANYYWFDSRNVQFMNVDRSPVSTVFGFYIGGQNGRTVSVATSFYF